MKRYISFLLAAVMLLTLLPVSAAADSSMTASDNIKLIIKSYEGCRLTAYILPNESNYTIGWGHSDPSIYAGQTITQEEADALFEEDIKIFEDAVNGYNTKYKLNLTQSQFDALISITYNFGAYWVEYYKDSWRLAKYVANGFKDSNGNKIPELEIADAMAVLCSSGGDILPGLIKRRLCEANLFFYNEYRTDSSHFCAVVFDRKCSPSGNRLAVYYSGQPYGNLPSPTNGSQRLDYWEDSDGNKITNSTVATSMVISVTPVWTSSAAPATYKLTVVNGTGSGSYKAGEKIRIAPNQKTGYTFDHWEVSGGTVKTENGKYYITMPKNAVTATAVYSHNCEYGDNCPAKQFKDINEDFWAHDSIGFVVSEGLFNGTAQGKFSPGLTMTRGMLITVLYRLAGSPDVEGLDNPFTDVPADSYYCAPILWAHSKHIANGYQDETFRPENQLTREQLATFLHRYANNMGFDTNNYADLDKYSDAKSVSEFARESMCWAVGEGIIKGVTETTLCPTKSATRAEVATMVMRFAGGAL